jgi:2-oxoglutarate dehydrogenase E2 component (dihydrolipoamide succinyltransferase)
MSVELRVPAVGESITEVQIGNWLKQVGDYVEMGQPVVEIESEKATVELPAPVSGTITRIVRKQGEKASVNELIGEMEAGEKPAGSDAPVPKEKPADTLKREPGLATAPPRSNTEPATGPEMSTEEVAALPAAQRELKQRGIDAKEVEGTGRGKRVLKEDVVRHAEEKSATPPPPPMSPSLTMAPPTPATIEPSEYEEVVAMSPMRRTIAQRLVQAQQSAALLTTFNEADMSEVMGLRARHNDEYVKKYGIKLGFMSFFVKACVDALKQFPSVNAEVRGDSIIYKNHYDIGVAVGGGKGLVVPVLRNADRMSFAEVEKTIAGFGERARGNRLSMEELTGGTFTISNGGIYGSMLSTPIVNPPQSGILGMHAIQDRPVAREGQVVIRPMMYIALTYDHRIVDGREAVSFLKRIKDCIENPTRILIEV